jgi:hypothetical protein
MSDNGHFRPFLDTFRIPLGKMVLLLFLAVLVQCTDWYQHTH